MVRLQTLGELRLGGEGSSALSSRRKELVLLTYLARRGARPLSREQAAALLWEDREERRGRQSLRQAVLELRRLVGEGLGSDADQVWLDPPAVELDATLFEREVDAGLWEEAVARWRGEFLAGVEDVGGEELRTWLEAERESLRRRLRTALGGLIARAKERGAWPEGIGWAERWLSELPLDQRAHLQLLELLHLDRRTGEALARDAAFRVQLEAAGFTASPELAHLAQVLGRAESAIQRPRASAVLLSPDLVGRGQALAELNAAWDDALRGSGAVVLAEGELGIGRTRLGEEFARRLAARPERVGVYAAHARQDPEPEELGVVRRLAGALACAAGLPGAPASALAVLARIAPAIRERFPALPEVEETPESLAEALREGVAAVAEESPTLLFVDDLPQADPASRNVLLALAEHPPARCMLLFTARTGPDEPQLALRSDAGLRRLKLQPLSLPEVELVLSSILELPQDERHQLAARLHQQGGGNPFYIVELVSALADEGTLAPTERGAWRLTAKGDRLPLPTSIRDVIARRVARLSPPGRSVLEAAAILALPFDRELLAEVAGESPVAVEAGLEELMLHRLIREAEASGRYQFAHELVRRHVSQTVPVARAEAASRRAIAALERRAGDDPAAGAALAQHRARLRAPGAARRRRRRIAIVAALVVGVLAVTGAFWLARERAPARLDANLVAVAPFDVLDPRLAVWREGMVDILSRSLDGAGPLRTAAPSVVIQRWRGRADASSAGALGRRTGAGLVVVGRLMGSGRDSVRVTASIVDPGGPQVLADIDRRAPIERMDQLADSVAVALLSELSRTRPIGAFRLASIGASSLAALKAYLQGEQFLRRAAYDSALVQYRRAIELDSSFALALRRTSMAIDWSGNIYDTLATVYALRAGRLNRRLAPRDSLLVAADSQSYALYELIATGDSGFLPLQRRMFQTIATAVARYPDGPDVWFSLGEAQYHFGSGGDLTTSNAQVLRTFERVIALDSTFVPSYEHAVDLSLLLDDEDGARRYARAMLRHGGPGVKGGGMRLVLAALDPAQRRGEDLDRMIDNASSDALNAVHYVLWKTADSGEIAIRALRAIRLRPTGLYGNDSVWTANILAALLEQHGHLREACVDMDPRRLVWPAAAAYRNCGFLGVVPADSVNVGLRTALAEYGQSGGASGAVYAGLLWWTARGDTGSLVRAQHSAAGLQRSGPDRPTRTFNAHIAASAAAFLALARRDTAEAVSRLTEIVETGCVQFGCDDEGLTLGEVLTAHGDAREAYAVLRSLIESRLYKNIPLHLALGRAAERIGEKAQAMAAYRYVARGRAKGDPEAQPYVTEARAGIERLLARSDR